MTFGGHNCQKGFTLLELLISMTLLALVVLIAGGAMRLGFSSTAKAQGKIESLERFRTSLNLIESQIQSAMMIKQSGTTLDTDFSQFSGSRNSMQFRSVYSLLGASRGPVFVTYAIREEGAGKKALFASESSVAATGAAKEIRLLDNATELFFEYYYRGPTDEKGQWIAEWTIKDSLPNKIRLIIEMDRKELSMVIPVRTGVQVQQLGSVGVPGKR